MCAAAAATAPPQGGRTHRPDTTAYKERLASGGECSILTRRRTLLVAVTGDRRVQLQLPPEQLIEIVRHVHHPVRTISTSLARPSMPRRRRSGLAPPRLTCGCGAPSPREAGRGAAGVEAGKGLRWSPFPKSAATSTRSSTSSAKNRSQPRDSRERRALPLEREA